MKQLRNIPFAKPSLTRVEKDYVRAAMESGWISGSGEFVEKAEAMWNASCGSVDTVTVSNGTVAIHLLLKALGVGFGDEVIVPNLTYIATANAVIHAGATPVLVDVDDTSWCIDPELLELAISDKTKAILAVNLLGHPCDINRLERIAIEHDLILISDSAQAQCASYDEKSVGNLLFAETFSFHSGKLFVSGEGGAITVNSLEFGNKLRLMKDQGKGRNKTIFHEDISFNYRLTNVQAAILCGQLERKAEILGKRDEIFRLYDQELLNCQGLTKRTSYDNVELSKYIYSVAVNSEFSLNRDDLLECLNRNNIEARRMHFPLNVLPMYSSLKYIRGNEDISRKLSDLVLLLPTYTDMTSSDIQYIMSFLNTVK